MDQPREKLFGLFLFLGFKGMPNWFACGWILDRWSLWHLAPWFLSVCLSLRVHKGWLPSGAGWHSGSKKGTKSTSGRCFLAQMFQEPILDKESSGEIIEIIRIHSDWSSRVLGNKKSKRKILRSEVLMSINGYDLSVKENPNAVKAFSWQHWIENDWNMGLNGSWLKIKICLSSSLSLHIFV